MIIGGLCHQVRVFSHGWWYLGNHDQKHSANGGVLTKNEKTEPERCTKKMYGASGLKIPKMEDAITRPLRAEL